MGSLFTEVKVTLDYERRRDKPFYFKVITDGTDEDMIQTVGKALQQKKREGELTDEDIQKSRSIRIDSDDKKGYFASIVSDAANFFKSF